MNEREFSNSLPLTCEVIEHGVQRGLHTGCQIYVSHLGREIADIGVGESHRGIPMTNNTINLWLSAGKPLTAVAILQQYELGKLSLDDKVVRFLPEFGSGGKHDISIKHLLVHTGGFRNVDTGWPEASWDEVIQRICSSQLEVDWIVGQTAAYHPATSWFILGEVLQRVTRRSFANVIREDVLTPLGLLDSWASISTEDFTRYGDRIGEIYAREQGELKLLDWSSSVRCAAASPGSNIRGPIRDLGRFYEMLLNRGQGPNGKLLVPETVSLMTRRHRSSEFDKTLLHVVDFGLGVIIDSNRYGPETIPYGYGKYCSERTFGHGGSQSSQGWCDPEAGLVVAYFFNGRAGEPQHQRRAKALNEAIYRDLRLD